MMPKVDRKQIHEFGNNTINKLIALHFTTSSKFFKMWEFTIMKWQHARKNVNP